MLDYIKFKMPVLGRFLDDKRAVTAMEYGLIAALIACVIIASVTAVGTSMAAKFTSISSSLK